jgi:hypothetical protein
MRMAYTCKTGTMLMDISFGAVVERSTANSVLSFFFPGEEFTTMWT